MKLLEENTRNTLGHWNEQGVFGQEPKTTETKVNR
jgi:hypothetical protein